MDAILTVAAVLASTLLLSILNNWQAIKLKREDWRRQDEVASKAVAEATKVAGKVAEVATAVFASSLVTDGKLDQIHTLVNSQMTEALRNEQSALKRELILLRAGPQSEQVVEATTLAEIRIRELDETLAERLTQAQLAEKQAEAAKAVAAIDAVDEALPSDKV